MASIALPPLVGPGARVYGESLAGPINGANLTFTTSGPFFEGSEVVYVNGVRQVRGAACDYVTSESGGLGTGYDTVTLDFPLVIGDQIIADYMSC